MDGVFRPRQVHPELQSASDVGELESQPAVGRSVRGDTMRPAKAQNRTSQWAVLAEYSHPFDYLWPRRDSPFGLWVLNQQIVLWMAFFGQDTL
jgi:hypothetical protein